jgi:hypothetical protein
MRPDFQTTLLDRILDPLAQCLTPEAARQLVDLRADTAAQHRMDELAELSNAGQLSAEERAEYEAYISAANLLAIVQAKARRALSGTAA